MEFCRILEVKFVGYKEKVGTINLTATVTILQSLRIFKINSYFFKYFLSHNFEYFLEARRKTPKSVKLDVKK